jgi:PAS domain S-box-containing protein
MAEARSRTPPADETSKLFDEIEQLRTALEAAHDENARLAEDRDRLLRRVTEQARQLQAANSAYHRASELRLQGETQARREVQRNDQADEEVRVAFEELQVLTEELEVANNALRESNRELDRRVEERTQELGTANAALRASELRFRTLIEGMPQLVWRAAAGGQWTWASPQWCAHTGLSEEETLEEGWLRALHPDDRDAAREAWRTASPQHPLDMESRIYSADEQRYRHFRTRALPLLDDDGSVLEWLGTSTDVDDLLQLQAQQSVLVAELQHRVRNMLAVVRSVFNRTAEAGGDLEDIAQHFTGRLDALARTQVIVTRSASGMVDLESMIREELLSVGAGDGPNLTVEGPEIAISSKTAETLGLAIHELTTNSLKYGALKISDAHLSIRWESNIHYGDAPYLHLVWEEQGVPAVSVQPAREGFGRELIEEALPYRLGAETVLEFRGGGIRCSITLPLSDPDKGAGRRFGA